MKIKTICDVTGMTDRTIRYYIEQRLISPAYTENYLGRKSFDFSQEDMNTLKDIAILRKFDFSVDEIRRIIEDASTSSAIISDIRFRTNEAVLMGEEKLQALSKLSEDKAYTIRQLAEELSKPANKLKAQGESIQWRPLKVVLRFIKSLLIFTAVWLPIVLSLLVVMDSLNKWRYPIFSFAALGLTVISFWPSISVLALSKTRWNRKKILKGVLLILCVLSIPISLFMSCCIILGSKTTDFVNYRDLDADCLANRSSFFHELFPKWPHYFECELQPDGHLKTVYLDAHYYYCKRPGMDYTYDIYAEWPLEKDNFDKEVARVRELFETKEYEVVQKGSYTCFFSYNGDPPFEEVTDSYTYFIFAYNETNLVVRYIMCDSLENGLDQPYYLSLEW